MSDWSRERAIEHLKSEAESLLEIETDIRKLRQDIESRVRYLQAQELKAK